MVDPDHVRFMALALKEARKAAREEEVPVGAVLTLKGEVIACTHNRPVASNDPTAHAEILAIRKAAKRLGNYRLVGSYLYVTLEPCAMCVGAMVHARISKLIFGAYDEKMGMVKSCMALLNASVFNHRVETVGGVLRDECGELLQEFFRQRRVSLTSSRIGAADEAA